MLPLASINRLHSIPFVSFIYSAHPDQYSACCEGNGISVKAINRLFGLDEWKGRELELCARLVGEDLILLRPGKEEHELAAACVAFSFGLEGRLGAPLSKLHRPVPGYQESLAASTERALRTMQPDRGICRSNWELRANGEMLFPGLLNHNHRGQVTLPPNAWLNSLT